MMIAIVVLSLLAMFIAGVRDCGLSTTTIAVGVTIPFALAILALGFVLH
jgi:hypothetical protein